MRARHLSAKFKEGVTREGCLPLSRDTCHSFSLIFILIIRFVETSLFCGFLCEMLKNCFFLLVSLVQNVYVTNKSHPPQQKSKSKLSYLCKTCFVSISKLSR